MKYASRAYVASANSYQNKPIKQRSTSTPHASRKAGVFVDVHVKEVPPHLRRLSEQSDAGAPRVPPEAVGRRAFWSLFVAHKKRLARRATSGLCPATRSRRQKNKINSNQHLQHPTNRTCFTAYLHEQKAAKQQSSKAAKQQSSKAAKQQSSKAAKRLPAREASAVIIRPVTQTGPRKSTRNKK